MNYISYYFSFLNAVNTKIRCAAMYGKFSLGRTELSASYVHVSFFFIDFLVTFYFVSLILFDFWMTFLFICLFFHNSTLYSPSSSNQQIRTWPLFLFQKEKYLPKTNEFFFPFIFLTRNEMKSANPWSLQLAGGVGVDNLTC